MATLYVDLSATTNGSGTELSPYNSFAAFVSSITSGDRIRVKRGTSKVLNSGTRLNVAISGALETLIDTYGEGVNPILSGGGAGFNPIYIKRVDGGGRLIVRDLDVTAAPASAVVVESASGVTISNVLLQRLRAYGNNTGNSAGQDGIRVSCAKDGGLISNVVIESCDAFDNNGHGIKIRDNTQNIIARWCKAWNNGLTTPAHGMGTCHSSARVSSAVAWSATSGGAYQATISTTSLAKTTITQWLAVYCTNQNGYFWLTPTASSPPSAGEFYTGGSNTLEINVGAAPTAATVYASYLPVYGTFIGNEVWGTIDFDGLEGHGLGIDELSTYTVGVANILRDNEGAGILSNFGQGADLVGNAVLRNAKQGIYATGGKSLVIESNTIASNVLQGYRGQSGATGQYMRNNIIMANGGYGISSSSPSYTIDEDYNCIYGNTGGALENVSTSGANGITSDPLLTASYRLTSASPCKGAGVFIDGAKHFGSCGMNPTDPDIGAHRWFEQRSLVSRSVVSREVVARNQALNRAYV